MKKQFLILAVTFISFAIVSCSKDKLDVPPVTQQIEEIGAMNNGRKPGANIINPLDTGLFCRFEFNSNLKDTTGLVPDWTSTANRVLFTKDRKGQINKAIRFNEAYGLYILGVPVDTVTSVSVWVKHDMFPINAQVPFFSIAQGIGFAQLENIYNAHAWNGVSGQYVLSGPIDNKWHHLAATKDKISLKVYFDGVLIGTSPTPPGTGPSVLFNDYVAGYGFNAGYKYWKGDMDDLRIYKRVLTPSEISKLANL